MSDSDASFSPEALHDIFAQLKPHDVELFYASYQQWALQQEIASIQTQIETLHQQIAENEERKQHVKPSAIALATLARLQSNGVNDIDLLDRMLECGESWLDQTMQRLEYCERSGLIGDDYTAWCENALEGAFNWIDSMQEASKNDETATTATASAQVSTQESNNADNTLQDETQETPPAATEEQLLQKLMSEDIDEASLLEPTLKIAAISPRKPAEDTPPPTDVEEIEPAAPVEPVVEFVEEREEVISLDELALFDLSDLSNLEEQFASVTSDENVETGEIDIIEEDTSTVYIYQEWLQVNDKHELSHEDDQQLPNIDMEDEDAPPAAFTHFLENDEEDKADEQPSESELVEYPNFEEDLPEPEFGRFLATDEQPAEPEFVQFHNTEEPTPEPGDQPVEPEYVQFPDSEEPTSDEPGDQPVEPEFVEFPDQGEAVQVIPEQPQEVEEDFPDELPPVAPDISTHETAPSVAFVSSEIANVQEPAREVRAQAQPQPRQKKVSFWQRLFGRFGWR